MLSIVIAARNDGYGGDFLGRLRISLQVIAELTKTYGVETEVVIVEWNPPSDRPRLSEATVIPDGLRLRIVTVPAELHSSVDGAELMPMFEYRAKNVGIRRASGSMVLVTNPDIVFSAAVIDQIGKENFERGRFYRARRTEARR